MLSHLRARLRARLPRGFFTPGGFSPRQLMSTAMSLLPSTCALCGDIGHHVLCFGCREQFFDDDAQRCPCCARRLNDSSLSRLDGEVQCDECLIRMLSFDATIAAADYSPPIDQLVLGLKFGNQLALAPLFADLIRDALLLNAARAEAADASRGVNALPDFLTAVPLGKKRLHERGFNQAVEIAKPLAVHVGVPLISDLLIRVRDTAPQAQLSPTERRLNLLGAFTLDAKYVQELEGKHVGIVDDVFTTGETLNEIAATLKRFGAARVTNFVFARTVQK